MKNSNAVWLYNEVMAPTAPNGENNLLSVLGGAAIGAGAPTLITSVATNEHASYTATRGMAVKFLRDWADSIERRMPE